jgi:DNA-binding CsgD family transcriptional regulator
VQSAQPAAGGQLSERELEVLRGIARGHTNAEIAAALHVSVSTIETHRAHIQQKLGTRTRAELSNAHAARICSLMTSFSNADGAQGCDSPGHPTYALPKVREFEHAQRHWEPAP